MRAPRGLRFSMKRLMVPPLPAASRPSNRMTSFCPASFIQACILSSSTCKPYFWRSYVGQRPFLLRPGGHGRPARHEFSDGGGGLDGCDVAIQHTAPVRDIGRLPGVASDFLSSHISLLRDALRARRHGASGPFLIDN